MKSDDMYMLALNTSTRRLGTDLIIAYASLTVTMKILLYLFISH